MIIVGYQGIGKSTLAGTDKYIDLESGNMWVNGKRADDWYIPYCQIAVHLSQQGFRYFVASHKVVRDELAKYDERLVIAYPALELKEAWIEKLVSRYNRTESVKDYKAMMNAIQMYEENIKDLMSEVTFEHLVIKDIDYDLRTLLEIKLS